jgi:hypothetical protein
MFQRRRLADLLSPELAGSISPSYGFFLGQTMGHGRVMDVQAVNPVDFGSASSEKTREGKEPEGFGPQVIGRKVVDPGVYEDEFRLHFG